MIRQIVLDTETTGLEWRNGHRVVEIGCVELVQRRLTGHHFHAYINPECDFEPGAAEVTGLTREFLSDKPLFHEVADAFLAFVDGTELLIHNAGFDLGFLDNEFGLAGSHYGSLRERTTIEDTLALARHKYPGQRNSLDALCRRLGIDNSHREKHGALLDAELLAEVYLAMTSGQEEIGFVSSSDASQHHATSMLQWSDSIGERPRVVIGPADAQAHLRWLERVRAKSGKTLWPQ